MKFERSWLGPAAALMIGLTIVSLATVDYVRSPAQHKGIQIGPIFIPIGSTNTPIAGGSPGAGANPGAGGESAGSSGSNPTPGTTRLPSGAHRVIFAFGPSGHPSSTVAALPKMVGGVSWIFAWRTIEPNAPVNGVHNYNWAPIDNALAAAAGSGRTSMVRVIAGGMSPNWVTPHVTFTMKPNGPMGTQTVTMPIPWDSGFLSNWTAFIRAYGARYNRDGRIWAVQMPGAGWQGEMTLGTWPGWTSTAPPPAGMGSDPATDSKLITAWNTIIDAYRSAFPTKPTALDLGDPLNDGKVLPSVLAHAQGYGSAVYLQNNGLRASMGTHMPGMLKSASGRTVVGYQEWGGGNSPSNLLGSFQIAVGSNATYIEVYQNDCANAANDGALTWFVSQ